MGRRLIAQASCHRETVGRCTVSRFSVRSNVFCFLLLLTSALQAAEWSVPVGGNAFRSAPSSEGRGIRRDGMLAWGDSEDVYSVYFHVNQPAKVTLSLNARVSEGTSEFIVHVGDQKFPVSVSKTEFSTISVGQVELKDAGYVRIDIQGEKKAGRTFGEIRDVVVASDDQGLKLDYVKTNDGNMFYWGRRGPSVHLTYEMPKDQKIQYAYSEITVPKGDDVQGSYFMANGFGEGYFGMQVNGPQERRVLFSIWSPFSTDNPKEIPEDQRIVKLASGPDVRVGEFGNEGSGGQSYMVYPWKADATYCFLTEVKPDGPETTTYTSWFCDKATGDWRLIASFRRPKTNTYLRRFHSFLENFNPSYGNVTRKAMYGNTWVCDVDGKWHECTKARFSVDATGGGKHRLDFTGGADGSHFYMKNCGFFNETGKPGDVYTRQSNDSAKPVIDFDKLPRS